MPTKNPYSFKAKIVKRSKGKSAVVGAAYQAGEKLIDERTGRRCNYSRKKGVVHSEILAPPNSPAWAMNRGALWNTAEKAENRKDAQTARKFILALPKELTHEQRQKYAREFIQEQFVARGMVADFSIHLPDAGKNQDNHHLHLMLTMRDIGPAGFGKKNRDWNKVPLLETWREQWAVYTNRALEAQGFEPTWDHRTLEEQGIERIPQIHLGQAVIEMENRGIKTERAERALEIHQANLQIEELKQVEKEIRDENRLGESREIPEHAGRNRISAPATPDSQPKNYPNAKSDRSHGPSPKKTPAAAPENRKTAKSIQPTTRPTMKMNESTTGGPEDMNLSPSEYQEFLRVKRLMAQQQAEEAQRRQKELSEEQKKRIEELLQRAEAASLKRPDSLYWEDCFAMDCLQELHQRKQTVEQANWEEIESKVVCGLLADGATVKDAAEILYEKGVSPASFKKKTDSVVTPPDGQTTKERLALLYLKTLAADDPGLTDAVEQAEKRQEAEALNAQREKMQQTQTTAPQPGAA